MESYKRKKVEAKAGQLAVKRFDEKLRTVKKSVYGKLSRAELAKASAASRSMKAFLRKNPGNSYLEPMQAP